MGGFWHFFGIIVTIVSTVLGAGVGWGSMRAGFSDLKETVNDLKAVVSKVNVLEADAPKIWSILDDHGKRIGHLEVDLASLPKSRRRK